VKALPEMPAVCIVKHNNPCGVARNTSQRAAFVAARECDPVSAFGGIMAVNRPLETATAQAIGDLFLEAIIAPAFEDGAMEILQKKKNLRLLETGPLGQPQPQAMLRSVVGGVLVQGRDLGAITREKLRVVSKAQPTDADLDGLLFAWRVAKFVKSNAIIYTSRDATIGIGAGQMSRIDSTNIGAVKAQTPVRGAYMASDAFFPFRDNVDRAADIGIKAIISPGGSVRDEEVIQAADEHGLVMVFTGMRHFRH
jgi:phosphoribosylaminoimidazolecarboxamide formyltransferase/IMP cyclohydrolase